MALGPAVPLVVAVGGGLVSAFFYLSVMFGGMGALILGYLAPLPLFLTGLWLGAPAVMLAGLAGTAAVMLGTSGGMLVALSYLVTGAAPAILVVRQSLLARSLEDGTLEWYPPGRVLVGLTGMGMAALLAAVILTLDQPGGLEGLMQQTLARVVEPAFRAQGQPAPDPEAFWVAAVLPGLVAVSWLVMTIVNAVLAQGVLMRFGRNRRPAMRLDQLELPNWLVPLFAVAVVVASIAPGTFGFLAANIALLLAVPFAFAGLSVVHVFASRRSARTLILVGFYMMLFLFGWPILLLVGLGMIEQWIGLRRRFSPAAPGQEDE
ncbi:membrane protein [Azospirillum thiophilum]|uniref:DUF2232 domain-containing protein n=1 Tax=Azospirillum thiophilum TaxID=528244 RepID=A0AAC8VXP1_9PROT|nr:DUF2232 domain-containing protein [Azospirillum thiophilum]ALG71412.1 hypothetical protein AL072_11375 [Azospirillum thiophilum]KJR64938.1 membrane protein [Azospirillum thiophilum]